PTAEVIAAGRGFRRLGTTFVVNDDVDAALELGADGVHLGQSDQGAARARARGLLLGRSATTYEQALAADADYLGVGPIWATPSKEDADPPIGLAELEQICRAGDVPAIASGVLVEAVHFRLDWLTWRELGFRAAAVNLSDLAASGAEPQALVVTFAAPAGTEVDDVLALYEGLAEAGVPVVGGDTSSAPQV